MDEAELLGGGPLPFRLLLPAGEPVVGVGERRLQADALVLGGLGALLEAGDLGLDRKSVV